MTKVDPNYGNETKSYIFPWDIGPNLGPFYIRQSDATPFCEDYAKHLENGFHRE